MKDVIAAMVCDNSKAKASRFRCRHSPTLLPVLRDVHKLSSKHEIVFNNHTQTAGTSQGTPRRGNMTENFHYLRRRTVY